MIKYKDYLVVKYFLHIFKLNKTSYETIQTSYRFRSSTNDF